MIGGAQVPNTSFLTFYARFDAINSAGLRFGVELYAQF